MNAPASLAERLQTRLRELALAGDGVGGCMGFQAPKAHTLRSMELEGAMFALPLQGLKRVRADGQGDVFIHPGELLLVPGPCRADVENIPEPGTGLPYLALGLAFAPEVLAAARTLHGGVWPAAPASHGTELPGASALALAAAPLARPVRLSDAPPPPDAAPPSASVACAASAVPVSAWIAQTLLNWCDAVSQGHDALARHALVGLVLHLCALGHTTLLQVHEPSLAARIRRMVSQAPAREWASADVEVALGLSGATLRRRLAAEGTQLREVLTDARLAQALSLLFATRLPLKTVAARVGYASLASFNRRFAQRYGVEPGRVGHARPALA